MVGKLGFPGIRKQAIAHCSLEQKSVDCFSDGQNLIEIRSNRNSSSNTFDASFNPEYAVHRHNPSRPCYYQLGSTKLLVPNLS